MQHEAKRKLLPYNLYVDKRLYGRIFSRHDKATAPIFQNIEMLIIGNDSTLFLIILQILLALKLRLSFK